MVSREEKAPDCGPATREMSVEQVSVARLPTEIGEFRIAGYRSLTSDEEFVALFKGEFDRDTPTLARIHHRSDGRRVRITQVRLRAELSRAWS